jgi:hypothetical protein
MIRASDDSRRQDIRDLLTVVAAVNNEEVLAGNLLRSGLLCEQNVPYMAQRGYPTAGQAYNAALARVQTPYVAFVHQDVYIPRNWERHLLATIATLEAAGTRWGVLGVWGLTATGASVGRVWCTASNIEYVGNSYAWLSEVVSIDELAIILKTDTGLRFDGELPGYHLYGTDIILRAQQASLLSLAFTGPVIHNCRRSMQPDRHYIAAYQYMQRKWRSQLPVWTLVVPLTRWGWPLYRKRLRNRIRDLGGGWAPARERCESPEALARQLGYESTPATPPACPTGLKS